MRGPVSSTRPGQAFSINSGIRGPYVPRAESLSPRLEHRLPTCHLPHPWAAVVPRAHPPVLPEGAGLQETRSWKFAPSLSNEPEEGGPPHPVNQLGIEVGALLGHAALGP